MANPIESAKALLGRLRQKRPFIDHLARAGSRFQADAGNSLAAAVTYFSFLSLFPLLLLALSVLGFVLTGHPELQAKLLQNVQSALPGGGAEVTKSISAAVDSRAATGIVGVLGLLYAGLSWVDNLRIAVRTAWHQNVNAGNFFAKKAKDLVILLGLGLTVGSSVIISGVGTAATGFVVDLLGLAHVVGIGVATKVVAIAVAVLADVLIFLWLFVRLPKVQTPWRRVLKGAVFAAAGFEILKLVGAFYIARVTRSATATYGAFGVVIGTLVWMNLVARFVVFSAVWTVTAPYDDDVAPSGTADEETAREAGIPVEFAREGAPDTRQQEGAPTPLIPALQDRPGAGFGPRQDADRSGSTDTAAPTVPVAARPAHRGPDVRGAVALSALAAAAALLLRRRTRGGAERS